MSSLNAVLWARKKHRAFCTMLLTANFSKCIASGYKARMERRKLVDPEGYQIYGLGEWGEIGGLILHNWETKEVRSSAYSASVFW